MERRLVRREGVFLHSIGYWSDVVRTWIGERERMIVRYDPRDLSRIHLLAPDGRYYDLSYRDLRRPPISLWEHRLALKRLREEGRAEVDEEAIFTAIDAMRGIAERASVESKVGAPPAGTTAAPRRQSQLERLPVARHCLNLLRRSNHCPPTSGCSRTWRSGYDGSVLSASVPAGTRVGRCACRDAHPAHPYGSMDRLCTGGSRPVGYGGPC